MRTLQFVVLALLLSVVPAFGQIPRAAHDYKLTLHNEYRKAFGLNTPADAFTIGAGTIHQESAWNPRAASAYAQGLAQFTPATWGDALLWDPSIGALGDIWNPKAAIRAMAVYHSRLYRSYAAVGRTEEDRWGFSLSGYNGGGGNTNKDRRLCLMQLHCDAARWFGHVELYSGRAPQFKIENRQYVFKIWQRWRPLYAGAGF